LEDLDQLIQECAAGDILSQERLYRKFYPALFLLCKRFFPDNHQALETLNDGMLKVFRNIGRYNAGKGVFFNWIYTIVLHTAINKCKAAPPADTRELGEATEISGAPNPFLALEWKDIHLFLDILSPATRIVCNLYYLEGFSIRDISIELHLRPGTVKWHLSETRKKLKPIMQRHYHIQPK
jgi:RNA polymerase sigma factor (sigma-70 family)